MNATVTQIDPVRTVHLVVPNDEEDDENTLCMAHLIDLSNDVYDLLNAVSFDTPLGYMGGHPSSGFMMLAHVPESEMDQLRAGLTVLRKQSGLDPVIHFAVVENTELL